ncbi:hypothetical protein ES708_19792 [subsurface metagenome]
MKAENKAIQVTDVEVDLLRELVQAELARSCAVIDDIVAAGYGEFIGKRAESNAEAVKVAVLALVRSPLADLERKLACVEVKPEPEPEPEPEVKPEPEPEVKPEPGKEQGKSKA